MRIAPIIAILLVGLPLSGSPTEPLRSARSMFKGVELYSWTNSVDGSALYSICQGTNRTKILVEIIDECRLFHDVPSLKAYLAGLAVGESVFWSIPYPDLALPPAAVVREIVEFAAAHQVSLFVAE